MREGISKWLKVRLGAFLLIPDYGRAAVKQWMNILFGETLVGAIFLVWWALTNPKNPPLIAIFVVAAIVAGYLVWQADHVRLIPRLSIKAANLHTIPVTRLSHSFNQPDQEQVIDHRIFIQLEPECKTDSPVYDCVGYLQRVEQLSNKQWADIDLDKNLVLQWSNEVARTIDQHPQSEKSLNVCFIQKSNHLLIPCVIADIPMTKFESLFSPDALFATDALRFHVQINCADRVDGRLVSIAPLRVCLEVRFESELFRPSLLLVDPSTGGRAT